MAELEERWRDASIVEEELRSKIDQLESIVRVNQAEESKRMEQLLRINATLSKELRDSERQRKQLEATVASLQEACGRQTTTKGPLSGKRSALRPASCLNIRQTKKRAVVE